MLGTAIETTATATTPCIEVTCRGGPRAMGLAQGSALRAKIAGARDALAKLEAFRMVQPRLVPFRLFRRWAEGKARRLLHRGLARDYPQASQRLAGIAAGAELRLGSLLLFNVLEPLLSTVRGRAVVPTPGACSAVAVGPRRSGIGEPIIARNFDYLPAVQPFYTLRDCRPEGGLRSLDFTIAPLAGAIDGMNERGLCITNNYAFTIDEAPASGTVTMLVSEALERCTTVEEAAAWIASRPRWGGGLLMLADATGDVASLELSSTRSRLRRPEPDDQVVCHTNAFACDEMRGVEVPHDAVFTERAPPSLRGQRVGASAEARDRRFAALLSGDEPLDPDRLAAVMADHGSDDVPRDTTPCVHGSYWNTTACLQLFPRSRRLRVSYTSACQAQFVEFKL